MRPNNALHRTVSAGVGRKENDVTFSLRDFRLEDTSAVNEVAVSAFDELRHHYDDWPAFSRKIGNMASLANIGELVVATVQGSVVGAVTYVGPGKKKQEFFPVEWPILRMLVVTPAYRGLGIGRALTMECVRRAVRDHSPLIALHTSPIMTVALPMYERLGFRFRQEAPRIFGVTYGIYVKEVAIQPNTAGADQK
jgi:ribosomal protein S18 acetylase RimI-like enzyme